jgi:hypothetical protein
MLISFTKITDLSGDRADFSRPSSRRERNVVKMLKRQAARRARQHNRRQCQEQD